MNNNKFSCDDQTTPHCITNSETQFQIDQFSSSDKGGGHGDISYDNYLMNNSPIKSSIFEPNPPQTFTEGVQNCNPICCPQTTSTSITNTLTISHAHRQPSSGSDELQPTKEPVGCDEQINFTEDLQENGDLSDNESEKICLIKGHWTFEEDRRLTKLVEEFGDKNWQKISKGMFGTRLGKQCRERWVNHLCSDIKKDYWSEEEEKMLILAHKRLGTSWADIAKEISGRPENSIKNHWYATKRKLCSSKKGKSRRPWTNPKIKSTLLLEYINEYHKEETSHNLECPPPSTNIPTSIDTHSSMPTLETFPNPASIDDCSYPTDSVFSRIYHEMMLTDDEFSFVASFYNDYHHSSSSDDIDNIMVGQEGLDAPREGMV